MADSAAMPAGPRRLAALAAVVLAAPLAADDGDLYSGFGTGGVFTAGSTSHLLALNDVVQAPDGAVVVVGHYIDMSGDTVTASGLHWRRVDSGGPEAECNVAIPGATQGWINAATFDFFGDLVVAGVARIGGHDDVLVARFVYPACDLDETFDGDGIRTFDFEPDADDAHAVGVGRILTGFAEDILVGAKVGPGDVGFARLNYGGTFDEAFGGDGKKIFDAGSLESATDFALGPNSELLLLGASDAWETNNDDLFVLAADPATGEGLESFGGTEAPWARVPIDLATNGWDIGEAIGVTDEGRIHVVGDTYLPGWRGAAAALDDEGAPAGEFSGDGKLTFAAFGAATTHTYAHAVAFQGDDKILIAGSGSDDDFVPRLYVSRRLKGGGLDSSFGTGGFARPTLDLIDGVDDESVSVAGIAFLDGRILVAGRSSATDINREFVLLLDNALIFGDDFESGYSVAW
jgi:hypothetical protein